MTVDAFLTALRVARLVGITTKLFDRTVVIPKRYCYWCEKTTRQRLVNASKFEFVVCDACHFTQPTGPIVALTVTKGGPTAVEHLIRTAHHSGLACREPVVIDSTAIDLRTSLMGLSYFCSQREIFAEPLARQLWNGYEALALMLSYRRPEEAVDLILLLRKSNYGFDVSERWREWQTDELKQAYNSFPTLKSPENIPLSLPGKTAMALLYRVEETMARYAAVRSVTREAGWTLLWEALAQAMEDIIAHPFAS